MDCPEIRLHLPPDMLAAALRPLRDGGAWVDPDAWAALVQDTAPPTPTNGPRYWCFAHADRLLRTGLAEPDLRVLLAGLQLVLQAARDRHSAEALAVVKATSLVLTWLPFEADMLLDERAADDARVYQLARALLPFVEASAWEQQERPVDLRQHPVPAADEIRWACMAGLAAKLHAEAVLARCARDLVQDPYDDPIPGTAPEIWHTPPEPHPRCSTLVDTGPTRPRLRVVEATDGVEVAPAVTQAPELELGSDAVPSRPYLQVALPPSCTPDGPDLDYKARAYLQGEQARRAGLGHGDNPHDDDLREAWANGYDLQTVGRVPARARELQIATDALLDALAAGGEPLHRAEELPGGTDLWGNLQPVDPEELAACMDSELDPEAAQGNVPTCTCPGCGGPLYGDLGRCDRCHPLT